MKANSVLIILLVIVVGGAAAWFIMNKKRQAIKPVNDELDKLFNSLIPGTNTPRVVPHSGQTFQGMTDLEFFQNLGMSEDFLKSNHSPTDLKFARTYTEDFARKGIKLTKENPLYNEIVRIAAYSPIINKAYLA